MFVVALANLITPNIARKTPNVSKQCFHRGGMSVLDQSVLLLAVAALRVIGRGETRDMLLLLGGGAAIVVHMLLPVGDCLEEARRGQTVGGQRLMKV